MTDDGTASIGSTQGELSESLSSSICVQYELFERQYVKAPQVSENGRFIGIDSRQQCQYDLRDIRSKVSELPMVQVVGDSGTAFDIDKLPGIQAVLNMYLANYMIEYGYTSMKHDTNWLVSEYLSRHPEVKGIANIVRQSIDALNGGWQGSKDVSVYLLLFDRLSATRFGDDVWLSDGIMFKEMGDRVLCLEGGPQTLYQCTNALTRGIPVVAVHNLRRQSFSAARMLMSWDDPESYLVTIDPSEKQRNVVKWCTSMLVDSGQDIASLLTFIKVT